MRFSLCAALLAAFLCKAATAAPYTLFADGTSVRPEGWTYTSVFDANLLFTPGVETISNASLTLAFKVNDLPVLAGVTTTPTGPGTVSGIPWDTADTVTTYNDPLDSVRVLMGAAGVQTLNASNASGYYQSSVVTGSSLPQSVLENGALLDLVTDVGPQGQLVLSNLGSSLVDLGGLSNSIRVTEGYSGGFSVTASLNPGSLSLFQSTGLLRYGYTVTGGDVGLESAALSFDAAASPVPEPWTPLMLLGGLGLLALRVRSMRR